MYALTEEKKYLDKTKSAMLAQALKFSSQSRDYRLKETNYYHEGPRFVMAEVGYDFIYHGLTQREHATIEGWLRTACLLETLTNCLLNNGVGNEWLRTPRRRHSHYH